MKTILLLFLTFCYNMGQSQIFSGIINGTIYDNEENEVWKLKLVIKSSTEAVAYFWDNTKSAYIEYTKDKRFEGQKRKVYFNAQGNAAVLQLVYESADVYGQSLYNFMYEKDLNTFQCLWSNLGKTTTALLGYGTFEYYDPTAVTYSSYSLKVGGKSFDYLSIDNIKTGKNATSVTIKIENNGSEDLGGTFHEGGSETDFYITDANRSKKYKLKSANVALPYKFTLNPKKTLYVTLNFEPIPSSMTMLNIFEGGETGELWKFYDVKLLK